jgi:hypothetical protein
MRSTWPAARRYDQLSGKGGARSRLRTVADSRHVARRQTTHRGRAEIRRVHGFDPDQNGKKLWSTTVGRGGELGGIEWGSASDGQNMYVPLSDITFKERRSAAAAG